MKEVSTSAWVVFCRRLPRAARRLVHWVALLLVWVAAPPVHAQSCPFDDGNATLTREGLILSRYALGITGAALVAGTDIQASDAPVVEASILCPSCGLDINGNGGFDAVDAAIIGRKIAGFSGAALTNGLNLGSGTRNTPAAVQSFLLAGCGATGGTVTSVDAGTGLTGGPITAAGTLSIAPAFRLPQACTNNQFARYNGGTGVWDCVTPAAVTAVTAGAGLTGGTITSTGTIAADVSVLQARVTGTCAAGSAMRAVAVNGAVTCETIPPASTTAWVQGGNGFGATGTLGTTDAQSLSIVSGNNVSINIGNGNGLRLNRQTNAAYGDVIAVVAGSTANTSGSAGSTVAGGGSTNAVNCVPRANCANVASALFSTIGGGLGNLANGNNTVVAGGKNNSASGTEATVSGGRDNAANAGGAVVSGGFGNAAGGAASAVVGGSFNEANGSYSTAMGRNAIARNWGQVAHAGNGFGSPPDYTAGTSQYSRMLLSYSTATGVAGELLADGTTASVNTERRLRFFANQSAFIDATVLAKQTGAAEAKVWSIKCIVMVDSAGAVTLSPSPCVPTVVQQTSALVWTVTVDSLTVGTDGVVRIRQTGANGVPTRWLATVHLTELME